MREAWRLALGTLTALPVSPPSRVDRRVATGSLLLAPLAALPLGVAAGAIAWLGRALDLAPLGVAVLVVASVVAGSRALHVDGLADTADALTSSYDAERSLAVMRSGDTGPAGVAAVVLVLGVQVAGVHALLWQPHAPVLLAAVVATSRVAHSLACLPGIPPAAGSRLGAAYAGAGRPALVTALWLGAAALLVAVCPWTALEWWRGPLALALAAVVVGLLVRRAVRRLGGTTGDVMGAAIELTLATLLLALT